jgi:uncharacterized protein (DUF608 family)
VQNLKPTRKKFLLSGLCCLLFVCSAYGARGDPEIYSGDALSGILLPVGGIGTGHVGIDGTGRRTHWWLTGERWDDEANVGVPEIDVPTNCFAAVIETMDGTRTLRALQTVDLDQGDFAKMPALTFRGEYPFGWYQFADPSLPVTLSLETFNPLIPGDSQNSGIPTAIYTFTAENTGSDPIQVSFVGTQQNMIGKGVNSGFGGNVNEVVREGGDTLLHLTSQMSSLEKYYGDVVLMALDPNATATASWDSIGALAADLMANGKLSGPDSVGPTADGDTASGALCVPLTLAPGEKRSVTFVLTWHFPNRMTQWGINPQGPMYANWWSSALDVARYLESSLGTLTDQTRQFHDDLYSSTFPYWFLDGLSSQIDILRSPVVFWNKDGFLGLYEGWRAPGHEGDYLAEGNCLHVTAYGQTYASLFPDLARTLREDNFARQRADGAIPNRTEAWDPAPPADGMAGEILSVYREYLSSPDQTWLDSMWPKVKKAMQYYMATWDPNQNGQVEGCQYDTYDTSICGHNTFIGSQYLAALAASEQMANVEGDIDFAALCRDRRTQGSVNQDAELFNGQYYIHNGGGQGYYGSVFSDQLLGQWWANQLGLGWLYPQEHVASAAMSIFTNNYHPDFYGYSFARIFADENDAGLVNGNGEPGTMPYLNETWTGVEYAVSALLIQTGAVDQGLTVFQSARGRYDDGELDTSWLGPYQWDPGGTPFQEVEYGNYSWRAQSNWSILKASQGLFYNGPRSMVRFNPFYQPAGHHSFFTAGQAWGTVTQTRDSSGQYDALAIDHGSMRVKELYLTVDGTLRNASAPLSVSVNGTSLSTTVDGNSVHVSLPQPMTLQAGSKLEVRIPSGSSASSLCRRRGYAFGLQR